MKSYLIKDTTREERERIVSESVGQIEAACDGCAPARATISFIADEAEFTPPVIFSRDARQKLVYRVEARPDPGSPLKPGQIVELRTVHD